jgi:hypothetical protein
LRLEFPEAGQAPWMSMAAAGMATSWLRLGTNVVVAFARSPMVTACDAWEMAANTQGRFRLGLGSQVKAHIERRYSAEFDPPGPRLRDYVEAVKACFRVFGAQEPLSHQGPYYRLSLLTEEWALAATPMATSRSTCPRSTAGRARWPPGSPTASTSTSCTRRLTCTRGCFRPSPRARRRPGGRPGRWS